MKRRIFVGMALLSLVGASLKGSDIRGIELKGYSSGLLGAIYRSVDPQTKTDSPIVSSREIGMLESELRELSGRLKVVE